MAAFNDFNNPQVAALPNHLRQYIVDQHYENYTPLDHAIWRYVMRQNYSYLKDIAYYPYIPGLKKAGLTIEKIPDLVEVNRALGKIGWGAVTVDGFIPPAAFMEYQAYRVLVIAAEIRQMQHIEYTPAPDIIHESAGHAPIIAESDYNSYLSYFGQIGTKAMYSSQDFELYEAIRKLSILKETPDASQTEISKAEEEVAFWQANMGEPSEMALLSRLHWWTVEYGLIGTLENPKIYGAGLLSSIGESATCMRREVKKLWYTLNAVNYPYDITKPQPQLFVTPDFQNLINVLEQFADSMAFRVGGKAGLEKAISSNNTCTAVYSSGLQVTGTFTSCRNTGSSVYFIKTTGPTALCYNNEQLAGHDKSYHRDGFSSPVGRLENCSKPFEDLSDGELAALGIIQDRSVALKFETGLTVAGDVKSIVRLGEKVAIITFTCCTVTDSNGEILFRPGWGVYDMAVGEKIISVFGGAADKDSFERVVYKSKTNSYHPTYNQKTLYLHQLYQKVRDCRQGKQNYDHLLNVWLELKQNHRDDWLCALEILEILVQQQLYPDVAEEITKYLEEKGKTDVTLTKLIKDGLSLIAHPVTEIR